MKPFESLRDYPKNVIGAIEVWTEFSEREKHGPYKRIIHTTSDELGELIRINVLSGNVIYRYEGRETKAKGKDIASIYMPTPGMETKPF